MGKIKAFLKRKDIVLSAQRYGIDALGAMAQGLFCTLLVGTILNTIGQQFNIGFLNAIVVTVNGTGYTIGAVLPDPGGLRRQRHGRLRRSSGCVLCGHHRR